MLEQGDHPERMVLMVDKGLLDLLERRDRKENQEKTEEMESMVFLEHRVTQVNVVLMAHKDPR